MAKKCLFFLLVCLCASFASATIVADSQADFIATGGAQNALGWSYGLYYPPAGWYGGVVWYTSENMWGSGDGRIGAAYMHPHSTDWQIFRNWTSNTAGTVDISGIASVNPQSPDGVTLIVKLNGAEIFSCPLLASDSEISYDITGVSINIGDNIMFALAANDTIQFDATTWTNTINLVPEPATISILALGLIGLVRRNRK